MVHVHESDVYVYLPLSDLRMVNYKPKSLQNGRLLNKQTHNILTRLLKPLFKTKNNSTIINLTSNIMARKVDLQYFNVYIYISIITFLLQNGVFCLYAMNLQVHLRYPYIHIYFMYVLRVFLTS